MANLIYVIGASGAGKDSLLRYARAHLPYSALVVFAHRYITRDAYAGGENHVALTESEFEHRQRMGCFAMHWHSHDTCYGVGIEINQWLAKGLNVVVNGSRNYLSQAAMRYDELVPVLIQSDKAILRERLLQRGRESAEAVEQRLMLADAYDREIEHPRLCRIDNNGSLEEAGAQLLSVVQDDLSAYA